MWLPACAISHQFTVNTLRQWASVALRMRASRINLFVVNASEHDTVAPTYDKLNFRKLCIDDRWVVSAKTCICVLDLQILCKQVECCSGWANAWFVGELVSIPSRVIYTRLEERYAGGRHRCNVLFYTEVAVWCRMSGRDVFPKVMQTPWQGLWSVCNEILCFKQLSSFWKNQVNSMLVYIVKL